jgi:RNA polymerase sigma factor (sigma-70 family)
VRTKPAPQNHSATPSSPLSDQQIVEACLAGDERAWEMLIKKYKRLIYSFPRRYGARADDAEEVFQLVCVELFLSLAGLRDQQSLRAWITAVAKHQAYHWKRRHIKRSAREGEELNPSIAVSTPCASGSVEAQDRARVLRDAIGRLPPRDRALVRLLFFVDPPASYETIALRLGIAAGSVSSTRTRCLQKLARSMGGGHKR